MFAKKLAIVVSVRDEIGSIVVECEFNDVLDCWGFGEEGLDVWR